MKKQGFTLIELMVVIVIMGILAAVAVPKLFGQIAKSKASEVATNAAAYQQAQNAYVIGSTGLGKASDIGYDTPTSTNFSYQAETTAGTWVATASVGLNDCKQNDTWTLAGTYASSTGKVSWTATISNESGCKALTPGFADLANR